ncbi:MAG: flagellar basal body P-ring protein FlgI [Rhodobacterales bacterium]|nr:flagellar basal body P-ring protein FlgI [Rhodobacterales bacterium]
MKALFIAGMLLFSSVANATRAKDIGDFYGIRENQLEGAGIVVGLQRSGDSTRNIAALRTLANKLRAVGISMNLEDLSSRNIALVMVSATLPPDTRPGSRLDVTVASTGDATSLEGGMLLWTPLTDQMGNIVAVGEGSLIVGGFTVGANGGGARKNKPTVGLISGGAIVQIEVPNQVDYTALTNIDYILHKSDFTTAMRMADAVNAQFEGETVASAQSSSTINLVLPESFAGNFAGFAAMIENTDLTVDTPARIVVNERTGTVVMGADVKISAVAVAHGGLTIEVRRANGVSQPGPSSGGTTAAVSNSIITANEEEGQLVLVEGIDIGELVAALNDMGVKPRELIVILQAMRSSGALHAEIVTQ